MAPLGVSPLTTAFHKPLPIPFFSFFLLSFPPLIPGTRFFPLSTNHLLPSPFHSDRPSLSFPFSPQAPRRRRPCHAATPGPPPDSEPHPQNDSVSQTGLAASLSKFQDRVQIFFAVLFWMSLFFWASAWDERSRPDKGSRFRR